MKLIIVEASGTLVAEVENYIGPVPRRGENIVHPPLSGAERMVPNVMGVKTVTYGILGRPQNGESHFVGNAEPYVEICV